MGWRGATSKWPVRMLQLIIQLLVDGVSPSSIPGIMQTMNSVLLGQNIEELPTKRFAQQCRVIAQNVDDILVAIKIWNIPEWKQLFTDGSTSDSFFLIQGTHLLTCSSSSSNEFCFVWFFSS